MEWTLDDQSLSGELKLVGDLNVEGVAHFKQVALQAFNEAEEVTLNLEEVVNIDIAGLQIIYACHRFGAAHQKQLVLQTGGNPAFARVVQETGFLQWAIRSFGEEQLNVHLG